MIHCYETFNLKFCKVLKKKKRRAVNYTSEYTAKSQQCRFQTDLAFTHLSNEELLPTLKGVMNIFIMLARFFSHKKISLFRSNSLQFLTLSFKHSVLIGVLHSRLGSKRPVIWLGNSFAYWNDFQRPRHYMCGIEYIDFFI